MVVLSLYSLCWKNEKQLQQQVHLIGMFLCVLLEVQHPNLQVVLALSRLCKRLRLPALTDMGSPSETVSPIYTLSSIRSLGHGASLQQWKGTVTIEFVWLGL